MKQPKISIAVPSYEMHGRGLEFLKRNFDSLLTQTFKDFEVVVTDDSPDDKIRNFCRYCNDLDIQYSRSPLERGMARNTNNAIKNAKGELIKILYQDDYLAHPNVLREIIDNFIDNINWLVTPANNNPHPYYSEVNTIGSPSVLTIRNDNPILFNEDLKWVLDLDYYKQLFVKFGEPRVLQNVGIIMGIGDHQETAHLSEEIKRKEENA